MDNNSIGSNVGVWIRATDNACTGEVTLGPRWDADAARLRLSAGAPPGETAHPSSSAALAAALLHRRSWAPAARPVSRGSTTGSIMQQPRRGLRRPAGCAGCR